MQGPLGRRNFLLGSGVALCVSALEGCSTMEKRQMSPAAAVQLPPMRVSTSRITRITVCTRPFRAAGPRLDVEQIGDQTIVHNYGHGGSGWSLSWGSSTIAVRNALATATRDIAIIGCGALGLTSAILAQRAGLRVTIYAKDRPPNVRSSLASGLWTARFAHLSRGERNFGIQALVGGNVPNLIYCLSELSGPPRRTCGADRQLFFER